jgi:hypothetical protein
LDFLQVSSRREAIHARERGQCFYCLRRFVARGRVLDHVVPRARGGSNSYRNLVSSCVECNTQKGETAAEDFLRTLYRLRRLLEPGSFTSQKGSGGSPASRALLIHLKEKLSVRRASRIITAFGSGAF